MLSELQQWLLAHGRAFLADPVSRGKARLSQTQQALLEQQIEWRQRSRFRFPQPERWLWSDRSLAQASDWLSAVFKSALFPPGEHVVDGCCGAGVDAVALALRGPVTAVDIDPWLVALCQNNALAHQSPVEGHAEPLSAQSLGGAKFCHIDPDRRADEIRTVQADQFAPNLEEIIQVSQACEGSVIKVSPSTQFSEQRLDWLERCSRIWIGSFGECRQQLLLSGDLATKSTVRDLVRPISDSPGTLRAAVVLSYAANSNSTESNLLQLGGNPLSCLQYSSFAVAASESCELECTEELGTHLYDLHANLHASELQQHWALAHDLLPVSSPTGYFTGNQALHTSLAQCFEIVDVIAWDDRQVRQWLRRRSAGAVEVKCRLVKLDASGFQRRYSQPEGEPLTLIVTRLGKRVRCIVCRRVTSANS
jgi:THUMP domain-like